MAADGVTESEVSEVEDVDALDETLVDRISALKDMVPPTYRKNLANVASTGYSWAAKGLSLGGKTLWVVSTSALLLGVPWALAFSEEQQVQEMEREMRMQQSSQEVRHSAYSMTVTEEDRANIFRLAVAHTRRGRRADGC